MLEGRFPKLPVFHYLCGMFDDQRKYYYLIEVQYLGYRYHGWAKQKAVRTVQGMLEKTIGQYLGEEEKFKTLGAGRTDAKVSANHSAFELFTRKPVDLAELQERFDVYLPFDIRVLQIREVDAAFNILQHPKHKEYHYYFSCGKIGNAFAAPYMICFRETLDIELMQKGAKLFEGCHNFQRYTKNWRGDHVFEREIDFCEIAKNEELTASFFPPESYVFRIKGKGFLRNQVRLMMGALLEVGKGTMSLDELKESLKGGRQEPIAHMVPASGLILHRVEFD